MATFTENMRSLTDQLAVCAHERAEELRALRTQTEKLLTNAEELMERLGHEHEAMAVQVRTKLSKECEERTEHVAEMREQIGKRLQELKERFEETLKTCREARHEHLDHILQGFEEARQALAKDLHEASQIWRGQHGRKPAGREHGQHAGKPSGQGHGQHADKPSSQGHAQHGGKAPGHQRGE